MIKAIHFEPIHFDSFENRQPDLQVVTTERDHDILSSNSSEIGKRQQ
jgi:hypothetical protein